MASVGIGYQPLQQFKPDYYKLPFNELLAGLSAKQKQYDVAEDDKNKLFEGLLKVQPFYESDKEYFNQYQNTLNQEVDNLINKYQGDLSQAGPEIQKLARNVNRELTSGNLATVNYNTEQAKKILEDQASAAKENKFGEFSQALGLYPQFQQRQQMSLEQAIDPATGRLKQLGFSGIHRQVDRPEEVKNIFDPLKADLDSTDYFNPQTGYQNKQSIEGIFRPKIYQTALQNLDALSPNLQAELDYQIQSGQIPVQQAAERFIQITSGKEDVSKIMKNLSPQELEYYAKAYEIGQLGENRTFQKEQRGSNPNTAWMNLQRELGKEKAATKLVGFNNPIETSAEAKSEFDEIPFKNGKISDTRTFNVPNISATGENVTGTGITIGSLFLRASSCALNISELAFKASLVNSVLALT